MKGRGKMRKKERKKETTRDKRKRTQYYKSQRIFPKLSGSRKKNPASETFNTQPPTNRSKIRSHKTACMETSKYRKDKRRGRAKDGQIAYLRLYVQSTAKVIYLRAKQNVSLPKQKEKKKSKILIDCLRHISLYFMIGEVLRKKMKLNGSGAQRQKLGGQKPSQ